MTRNSSSGHHPQSEQSLVDSPWFLRPGVRDGSDIRLFCFSSAGYGGAMYQSWIREAGQHLDVYPVQLPGRANRLAEPPLESIPELATRLISEIAPLTDRPYALFGHSMGAALAAFTAKAIAEAGLRSPDHLFLSSRQPPDCPSPVPPLSHLEDDAFVAEINNRYGAIPIEILREPDVMAMLLPALRADVKALEVLEGHQRIVFDVPITAYGGTEDTLVPQDLLEGWRNWTEADFRLKMFPGGHYYHETRYRELLKDIIDTVETRKT